MHECVCMTSYPDNPLKGLAAIGLEGNRLHTMRLMRLQVTETDTTQQI